MPESPVTYYGGKKIDLNQIILSDALEGLIKLSDQSVHCCVTSPPYWGLRDYGVPGQLGLEENPEKFIESMVEVFEEIKRVLRNDGTLWLNIGDTYAQPTAGKGGGHAIVKRTGRIPQRKRSLADLPKLDYQCKQKDLVGIPWMLALALRSAGWYLRQDIIWSKPNPMPESVKDRCTKSHEYIFLMSKSSKYYFDAQSIKQPIKDSSVARLAQDIENQKGSERIPGKNRMKAVGKVPKSASFKRKGSKRELPIPRQSKGTHRPDRAESIPKATANKRSVWNVATKGYKEAHLATFPPELIVDCIKAGCPEDGVVLDPFMGAGTTALVARKLDRNYIGFELNPDYIKIAEKRLSDELGMFK